MKLRKQRPLRNVRKALLWPEAKGIFYRNIHELAVHMVYLFNWFIGFQFVYLMKNFRYRYWNLVKGIVSVSFCIP